MTMGVNRAKAVYHAKSAKKRRHGTYTQHDAGGPTRAIYGGRAPGRRRAKRIKKRRRR